MRTLFATSTVIVLLVLTGCSEQPETRDLTGSVSVPSGLQNRLDGGEGCLPSEGFEDVDHGASVVIRDAQGAIVGETELGWGAKDGDYSSTDNGGLAFPCRFAFKATVPAGEFYEIEVANRGSVAVNGDDEIDLTVGF